MDIKREKEKILNAKSINNTKKLLDNRKQTREKAKIKCKKIAHRSF